jgi:hypothetical protein
MDMAAVIDSSEERSKEAPQLKDHKWLRLLTKRPRFWRREDNEIHDHLGITRTGDVGYVSDNSCLADIGNPHVLGLTTSGA